MFLALLARCFATLGRLRLLARNFVALARFAVGSPSALGRCAFGAPSAFGF